MRQLLLLLLVSLSCCFGKELILQSPPTSLSVDFAATPEEITWGLMQRPFLEEQRAMVFTIQPPRQISFWSFNCLIDLSLACLDHAGVIREIYLLKAYPYLMCFFPPIQTVADLQNLSLDHPIVHFFLSEAVSSQEEISYVVELNDTWFHQQKMRIGDVYLWYPIENRATLLHTYDISAFEKEAITLNLPEAQRVSLWAPTSKRNFELIFLDEKREIFQIEALKGGQTEREHQKQVVISRQPARQIRISPQTQLSDQL